MQIATASTREQPFQALRTLYVSATGNDNSTTPTNSKTPFLTI